MKSYKLQKLKFDKDILYHRVVLTEKFVIKNNPILFIKVILEETAKFNDFKYEEITFYLTGLEIAFEYNETKNSFNIHNEEIWFKLKNGMGLPDNETYNIIKDIFEDHFKMQGITINFKKDFVIQYDM